MTQAIRDQIEQLKAEVQKRYEDGLLAIAKLEEALLGSATIGGPSVRPHLVRTKSRVQTVLDAIRDDYKTIAQLASELRIPAAKIRAVLYSKSVRDTVAKREVDNEKAFKIKGSAPAPAPEKNGSASSATHVFDVLKKHPEGLTRSQVTTELKGAIASAHTVSSALYNLKKSRRIDLSGGRYRVV
jgi:hypothetical protein